MPTHSRIGFPSGHKIHPITGTDLVGTSYISVHCTSYQSVVRIISYPLTFLFYFRLIILMCQCGSKFICFLLFFREKMGAYSKEIQRVAVQLIAAIIESLGLGSNYQIEKLENGLQLMAVNYYPHNNTYQNLKIGLPAHSDYGFITILLQTCGGLQISHNNGDSWQSVHIEPGTLHVHLGDYMEVLSNGRYRSLVHRAVLGCEERISIASIHGYSMDEKVKTLKELVDEQHPKRYQESSFRDFLQFISNECNIGGKSFIQSLRIV
jgi:isopenicillin N synthase-like dioxygenase